MQGSPEVIAALNGLLAAELTAINQYVLHAQVCERWGYDRLAGLLEKSAHEEMAHAEKLVDRILLLESVPKMELQKPVVFGDDVPKLIELNHALELEARTAYNAAVAVCVAAKDNGTRDLVEGILKDEESHISSLEKLLDQIQQMGVQNFLADQTK